MIFPCFCTRPEPEFFFLISIPVYFTITALVCDGRISTPGVVILNLIPEGRVVMLCSSLSNAAKSDQPSALHTVLGSISCGLGFLLRKSSSVLCHGSGLSF